MSIFKNAGVTKRAFVQLACIAAVWVAAARVLLLMPFSASIGFLLFQLCCVVAPGAALHKLFAVKTTPLQSLVSCYGLGLLAVVAVYFCFIPFGFGNYILYGFIALAVLSLAVLFLKRKQHLSAEADTGELGIAIVFSAVALAITFVLLSMAYLNPELSGTRAYYHDTLYGVNLVTAASRSFPMRSLMMSGLTSFYHMFYYAYAACLRLLIGLPSFETTTQLTLITISPFVAAAFTALARMLCKQRRTLIFAAAAFTLIPAFHFTHSLYVDTLGFPLSMGYCIFTPLLFFKAQQLSRGLNRAHLLAAVFLVGALGAKGPLAVSILFGICFVLLVELIRDKNWWVIPKGLLYAVLFFAFFMLLYGGGAGIGDSMSVQPFYSAVESWLALQLRGKVPQWLLVILSVIWYCLTVSPLFSVSFAAVLFALFCRKERTEPLWFCFGAAIEAFVMINLFKQGGSSEMYFVMSLYPILFAAALGVFEKADLRAALRKPLPLITAALLIFSLGYDAKISLGFFTGAAEWKGRFPIGIPAAVNYSVFNDSEVEIPETQADKVVTPEDYEAYLWLYENTPEDAVVVSYRYIKDNLYFCGSCFSERAFFLEGWYYITQKDTNDLTDEKVRRDTIVRFFFDDKDEAYSRVLAMEGCDYLMLDTVVCGDWSLSDKYVEKVFSNEATTIYKIKEFELA